MPLGSIQVNRACPGCHTRLPSLSIWGRMPEGAEALFTDIWGGGPFVEGPGWEDWAQSLAYYVYPSYDLTTYGLRQRRRNYVQEQIRDAKLP